jgi:hypothetical protein
MMDTLILTPRDDRPAKRSGQWAARLVEQFPSLSARVSRSREEVDSLLGEHNHLLYFGHGESDALILAPRAFRPPKPLVDALNIGTQARRLVVAVACWSGEKLARSAIDPTLHSGPVEAYIGWLDEVGWPAEWSEPIDDAVVEGLSILLRGGTARDCAAGLEAAFETAHDRYRAERGKRLASQRAALGKMYATYWRARMIAVGDLDASL